MLPTTNTIYNASYSRNFNTINTTVTGVHLSNDRCFSPCITTKFTATVQREWQTCITFSIYSAQRDDIRSLSGTSLSLWWNNTSYGLVLKTGYEKHFINVVLRNKNTLQQEIKTTVTKQTWNWLKVEEEIQQEWWSLHGIFEICN